MKILVWGTGFAAKELLENEWEWITATGMYQSDFNRIRTFEGFRGNEATKEKAAGNCTEAFIQHF